MVRLVNEESYVWYCLCPLDLQKAVHSAQCTDSIIFLGPLWSQYIALKHEGNKLMHFNVF